MAPPDNGGGRPRREGVLPDQRTKPTDASKSTPALGRLTWTGRPGLLPGRWRTRLREVDGRTDVLALEIYADLGTKQARALGLELLGLAQEMA